MTLVQITNYTSPNSTDPPQVNIHCIENFFTVHDFWATCACPEKTELAWKFSLYWIYILPLRIFEQLCACPEKQSCPGIFHCIENTFYIQEFWATGMRLPWKTEGVLNSQYWLYIFYHSGFLSNLRFPWKTELLWNFLLYWNIFYHSGFLSNLRLPWKTELPRHFSLYGTYFLQFEFLSNLRLPWKTELPWNFSLNWIYVIHSGVLSNLHALALKNRVAQKFFAVWNTLFTFRIFEQFACACTEKQSCPDIFHCIWTCIFYPSGFLSN